MTTRVLTWSLPVCAAATMLHAQPSRGLHIASEHYTLTNGLEVVLAPDTSAAVAAVAVYYRIGHRGEPKGHAGFAHLFEHLMFQGSAHLPYGAFIRLVQANGGFFNGNTRYDFTTFYEVVPPALVERMLWAEADRMRGLVISDSALRRQRDVVKTEVRTVYVNVPYGGIAWLDAPQVANTTWPNAHNFRGDFADLDAATLADARSFYDTYYQPNNAVLVVSGHIDPAAVRRAITEHFGVLPRGPAPPPLDTSEPEQRVERRVTRDDSLAAPHRPAVLIAYHIPPRGTRAWLAFGLIDQLVLQDRDGWLARELATRHATTRGANGGINPLGTMFNYGGPMLWTASVVGETDDAPEAIVASMDAIAERLSTELLDAATLERARVQLRSRTYDYLDYLGGYGTADMLAAFTLFDRDPSRVNRLDDELTRVTPALIRETARTWLRATNRTILTYRPVRRGR